jgi:hypothetical protein
MIFVRACDNYIRHSTKARHNFKATLAGTSDSGVSVAGGWIYGSVDYFISNQMRDVAY